MTSPIELDDLECEFKDEVLEKVPDALLDLCMTCGTCTGGCPASGLMDMDPRKLLRMVNLGMDEEIKKVQMGLGVHDVRPLRQRLPHEDQHPQTGLQHARVLAAGQRPKGIRGSCDQHIRTGNAMGVPTDDFIWTVEDVAEEIREKQPDFKEMQVTVDRVGAYMAINQNSREPVTEPDELAPLWKILHLVGADWTYPSVMWAGENYCLFLADEEGWRYIMEEFVDHIDNNLGCKSGGQHRVRALLLCDPGRIAQVQYSPQI
jgi:ferredoxin